MDIRRAMPVLKCDRPPCTDRPDPICGFYIGFLGFLVAMEEDGMLMLASRSTPTTQVIVAWPSPTAMDPDLVDVDLSLEVADVDVAYLNAQADGLQILRPLRDEPWGIRRFFLRDPAGRVVNVASHITTPRPGGPLRAVK